jgi:ABC-2 type transport system ATP-binding protein
MIAINGISFWYNRSRPVLEDLTLQMDTGGVYGVLGANGVGKTTLLQLIGGLLSPKTGVIAVDGQSPSLRQASWLEKIFYVPVEFDLPNLKVATFGRRLQHFYSKFDEKMWDNALHTFGILQGEAISALSFGQKKKVLLSFALASGCDILLFDEPTDGLDIPSKDHFRRLLSSYIGDSRMAVITTHHVHDVEMLLDHVIVLKDKHLLLNASLTDIAAHVHTVITPQLPPEDSIIYSERVAGGYHCLVKNTRDGEGGLNLELLFKAIQRYPELAKSYLQL